MVGIKPLWYLDSSKRMIYQFYLTLKYKNHKYLNEWGSTYQNIFMEVKKFETSEFDDISLLAKCLIYTK